MRKMALPIVAAILLISAAFLWADTPGTFRGVVIHGPDITPGWMYLKSGGQTRRVGIGRADVMYSDSVPAGERQKLPAMSIVSGAEVRVTAQQDKDGEWRATKIEILTLHAQPELEPSERTENLRAT
ncbi:MAG: hypothetical protein LAO06_18230 [Acidobacteriia bacterium]|nr:hypothetical protein [Terriglobia bacterium]MBZ5630797.1 hypothetical protein [Terriglobia bacterium]